jgi:signal transduction histidine kinase
MKRGETGVGQFYSPAFDGNMIAGYAVVPETGWGVMVPQPLSELHRRAGQVAALATVIAVGSFAAGLLSWLIAFYLARPASGRVPPAVLAGNEDVSVRPSRSVRSRSASWAAFNTMLEDLRRRNADIRLALRDAGHRTSPRHSFSPTGHEIRTPLNGVVGMIELLRLSGPSPLQQRYLDAATQLAFTAAPIDDVLDL